MKKIAGLTLLLLISGFAVGETAINTTLGGIYGQYTLAYLYNASTSSWAVYNPYAADMATNTLNYTSEKWGYWIKVNKTGGTTLNVTGTVPSSTDIELLSGWNLMGYPSTTAQAIGTALSGISGEYTLAYLYNASTSSWVVYNPYAADMATNSLNNTVPGYGYWIKVNATLATLTI